MALCFSGTPNHLTNPSITRHERHLPTPSNQPFWPSQQKLKEPTYLARARRVSSRTERLENINKKRGPGTTTKEEEEEEEESNGIQSPGTGGLEVDDGYFLPELPGDKPDFWEGAQWDGLGFFVQYQWAFGIGFALIACGIAVATYNEGATDFKQTPVYKESLQSRDLLEEPDLSNSDVFEANPTEEAPSLD